MKYKYIKYNDTYDLIIKDFEDLSKKQIKKEIQDSLKAIEYNEELNDSNVIKDVPVASPEREVVITHSPKNTSGTNPLTISMVETAYDEIKEKGFDNFKALVDMMLKSLKEDLAKPAIIRSNETRDVREKLLDDYVRLESLCEKAGYNEVLPQLKEDVDKLSEALDLNWFKKPNFTARTYKNEADELRKLYGIKLKKSPKKDSDIKKKVKAEFIITPTKMRELYNDVINEKDNEYKILRFDRFVSALKGGVLKDIDADYNRIITDQDTYKTDPFISQAIPEILSYYETVLKYVNALKDTELGIKNNLNEYAKNFSNKLNVIKKAWA